MIKQLKQTMVNRCTYVILSKTEKKVMPFSSMIVVMENRKQELLYLR